MIDRDSGGHLYRVSSFSVLADFVRITVLL